MNENGEFVAGVDDQLVTKEWIRERIAGRSGVQTELGHYLGIGVEGISKVMRGKRTIPQREALMIRKFFDEGLSGLPKAELPEDVDIAFSVIRRYFDPNTVTLSLSHEEARITREALVAFERLYSPERREDAAIARGISSKLPAERSEQAE